MKASHTHRALSPSLCQHASEEEYTSFVQSYTNSERYRQDLLDAREKFVRSYPDLREWFRVPLTERVGSSQERKLHPAREARESCLCRYLLFLGLRGNVTFDWQWIIALPPRLRMWTMMKSLDLDQDVIRLIGEAIALGFEPSTAEKTMRWAVSRLFLYMPVPQVERICEADLNEFVKALQLFGERPDVALFYSSTEQYFEHAHYSQAPLHRLHVVLYHRGQIKTEPPVHPPTHKPRMQAVLDRYLATRRLSDQPATVGSFKTNIRKLITWLERTHPAIETFAQVTRDHILEFAEFLTTRANLITGQPLATSTRRQLLSKISVFFQDVVSWEWADVPSHPLIKSEDLPKLPLCIPRYIPQSRTGPSHACHSYSRMSSTFVPHSLLHDGVERDEKRSSASLLIAWTAILMALQGYTSRQAKRSANVWSRSTRKRLQPYVYCKLSTEAEGDCVIDTLEWLLSICSCCGGRYFRPTTCLKRLFMHSARKLGCSMKMAKRR